MSRREISVSPWWTLAVLCLSLVMVVLGNTVLNVALPTLVRELGATSAQLQWMVDSYALVFAGLLLTAGALGDRFGRKGALIVGLVGFAIWEFRGDNPMLALSFFKDSRFSAASLAIMLVFFAMFGTFFLLTQYLQIVRDYSPLQAGLRTLPMAVTMMVFA